MAFYEDEKIRKKKKNQRNVILGAAGSGAGALTIMGALNVQSVNNQMNRVDSDLEKYLEEAYESDNTITLEEIKGAAGKSGPLEILDTDSEAVRIYKQGLFDKLQDSGEISSGTLILSGKKDGISYLVDRISDNVKQDPKLSWLNKAISGQEQTRKAFSQLLGPASKDSGISADVAGGVLQGTMMGAAVLAAGVLGAAITKKIQNKKEQNQAEKQVVNRVAEVRKKQMMELKTPVAIEADTARALTERTY